jgi:hypothetical protein
MPAAPTKVSLMLLVVLVGVLVEHVSTLYRRITYRSEKACEA